MFSFPNQTYRQAYTRGTQKQLHNALDTFDLEYQAAKPDAWTEYRHYLASIPGPKVNFLIKLYTVKNCKVMETTLIWLYNSFVKGRHQNQDQK